MSFILDALKKSEEERRKGEVPGLRDEPQPSGSRRTSGWMILLTAALLVNGLVFGWWLVKRQEPMVAGAAREVHGPQRAPAATVPVEPAKPAAPKPAADEPEDTATIRGTRQSNASPKPKQPVEPEVPKTATGVPVAAAAAEMIAKDVPSAVPAGPKRAPRKSEAPFEEQPVSAREPFHEAAAVSSETSSPSFSLLSDLSSSQRARLPEIRLQLHFYIDEPGRRMVRVNGTNLREGEQTGEGIEVVGIDAGGVRLLWQGIRLFLPAGG